MTDSASGLAQPAPHPSSRKRWRPTVAVDFDGVIHSYSTPWKNTWTIPDPPVPGAIAGLLSLLDAGYRVAVFSSRSKSMLGRIAMKRWLGREIGAYWLDGNSIFSDVETECLGDARGVWRRFSWPWFKPPAHVTIDDRCLTFNGRWEDFGPERIAAFRPWTKRRESNKMSWARAELDRIDFGASDTAVMLELLRLFGDAWDSGGAVHAVAPILQRLVAWKPLSSLTGEEEEWMEIHTDNKETVYQNVRLSSVFKIISTATGAIHTYDIDGDQGSRTPVAFPYYPQRAEVHSPVVEVQIGPSQA